MRLAAHLLLLVATGGFAYSAGWQNGHIERGNERESALLDRTNLQLHRDAADHARAGRDEELARWYDEAARNAAARQRQGGNRSPAARGHPEAR